MRTFYFQIFEKLCFIVRLENAVIKSIVTDWI